MVSNGSLETLKWKRLILVPSHLQLTHIVSHTDQDGISLFTLRPGFGLHSGVSKVTN